MFRGRNASSWSHKLSWPELGILWTFDESEGEKTADQISSWTSFSAREAWILWSDCRLGWDLQGTSDVATTNAWSKVINYQKTLIKFSNNFSWKEKCQQPFYAVLTSSGDSRYVMEENIKLINGKAPSTRKNIYHVLEGNTKMTNSKLLFEYLIERNKRIEDYMDAYDSAGGRFMPRPAVDALYPDD